MTTAPDTPYIALTLVIAVLLNLSLSPAAAQDRNQPLSEQLINLIQQHHYQQPSRAALQKLTYSELNAYLQSLDPYSRYLTPAHYAKLRRQRSQRVHVGLGINVVGDMPPKIAVPYQQGPASEAGFRVPSYLRSLNGQPLASAANAPQFVIGQLVKLGVSSRPKASVLKTYPIRVRAFSLPSVELVADSHSQQVIRIHQFRTDDTAAALAGMLDTQTDKTVIIDLRYCTGGSLYEAIDSVSLLLATGRPVVTLRTHTGIKQRFNSVATETLVDKRVYVLVGPYTTSSAEVFGMVLKQHQRGVLIGQQTRGKCLSQRVFRLSTGAAIQLSVYEITTFAGYSCQVQGIVPDIWLPTGDLVATDTLLRAGVQATVEQQYFVCLDSPNDSSVAAEQQVFNVSKAIDLPDQQRLAVVAGAAGYYACVAGIKTLATAGQLQQHYSALFSTAFVVLRFHNSL